MRIPPVDLICLAAAAADLIEEETVQLVAVGPLTIDFISSSILCGSHVFLSMLPHVKIQQSLQPLLSYSVAFKREPLEPICFRLLSWMPSVGGAACFTLMVLWVW